MARKRNVTSRITEIDVVTLEEAHAIVIRNKELEGSRAETIRNYKKFFKHLDRYLTESNITNLKELTERDSKGFMYYLLNRGIQNATINSYLNNAKGTFKILQEEGLCIHIFKNTKYLKTDEKKIDFLTVEEIEALLKTMNLDKYTEFRDYVFIHVLIDTFSRIGEALALTKEDIDFEAQTITFRKTKQRKVRTVPFSNKTASLLKRLIAEVEEFGNSYLFQSWNGKPLERSGREVSTKMKEYARRAGLSKRVYPHIFRHSASAFFLKETGNIRVLQKILGHSDITITQRYSHVLDTTVHDLHDKYSLVNVLEEAKKRKTKL